MTEPKVITEADAQKLANAIGCAITQSENGRVNIWNRNSFPEFSVDVGRFASYSGRSIITKLKIDSTRPWTEQIWRPE